MTTPGSRLESLSDDDAFLRFYRCAYEAIGKATKQASDLPEAKELSTVELCTALATACLRAAALALAAEPRIDPAEFDGVLENHLAEFRRNIAARAAKGNGSEWRQ